MDRVLAPNDRVFGIQAGTAALGAMIGSGAEIFRAVRNQGADAPAGAGAGDPDFAPGGRAIPLFDPDRRRHLGTLRQFVEIELGAGGEAALEQVERTGMRFRQLSFVRAVVTRVEAGAAAVSVDGPALQLRAGAPCDGQLA